MKKIDELPFGPAFSLQTFEVEGDLLGADGKPMKETIELWARDPVECVEELLSHSAFKEHAVYAPRRVYTCSDRINRVYDEMWTGDWWWEMQVCQI